MNEFKRSLVVRTPLGVHARLAVRIAGIVRAAQAQVTISSLRGTADASSPVALLQLALIPGETIELTANKQLPDDVFASLTALLGAVEEQPRRWQATGLVPGIGGGVPWWPNEFIGDALSNLAVTEPEADPNWSLARSRVDQQLAIEEQLLHEIGATELMVLVSAERQLLADERLTADLVLFPQLENTPGSEALADLGQRLHAALRSTEGERVFRQETVLLGYRVLLTHLLGPRSRWIRGIVTCEGGETSHTAIAARLLGIPMVTGFKPSDLEEMAACDNLVVDGREGSVRYQKPQAGTPPHPEQPEVSPAQTVVQMSLLANTDSIKTARAALAAGAAGIGLVRSEVFYLGQSSPAEETQYRELTRLLEACAGAPVTVRVANLRLDFKQREDLSQIGLAALLRDPEILRTQLRALMRAGIGHHLKALLPLVRTMSEVRSARSIMAEEQRILEGHIGTEAKLLLGVSIEVPALLWQLDEIVQESDFLSIGSNDLGALIFAQNRNRESVLDARVGLQPAFWRCIARVATAAQAVNKPVVACGVLAGQWPEALLLHGLGIEHSLAVDRLQPIAQLLSGWKRDKSRQIIDRVMLCSTAEELVQVLRADGIRVRPEA